MEQKTPRLCICRNNLFEKYYLSKDKRALRILEKYAAEIGYIIYFAGEIVESIDLSKLLKMEENAGENDDIRGGRLIEPSILFTGDI